MFSQKSVNDLKRVSKIDFGMERGVRMRQLLLQEIQQQAKGDHHRFTEITEESSTSLLRTQTGTQASDQPDDIIEGLGISKKSQTYKHVKKFAKNILKVVKNHRSKRNVVKEMLSTEKTYNEGLNWLVKWKTEITSKKLIKDDEINEIFSNVIDNIKRMSDLFLEDLVARVENWSNDSQIGDIYIKIAPFFNMYVDYCNNNELSGQVLEKLIKKNRKFKAYIEDQEKQAQQGIESYLITPIQRIPRYEMLLNSALKFTKKSAKDYEILESAAQKVHEVCMSKLVCVSHLYRK